MSNKYKEYKALKDIECNRSPFVSEEDCMAVAKAALKASYAFHDSFYWSSDEITNYLADFLKEFNNMFLRIELREARADYGTEVGLVMLANAKDGADFCTENECEEILENWTDYTELAVIDVDMLVRFNPADVITLGNTQYIIGDFIILEIDDNGNECGVNFDTIQKFVDFDSANRTTIKVDDVEYKAYRFC